MISHPVYHDIAKSILHHDAPNVLALCKTIPALSNSNLFTKGKWEFRTADQERLAVTTYRSRAKYDAVWELNSKENPAFYYYVIHEVKTGSYDINEVFEKYYSWQRSQIWIWAWHDQHRYTLPADPKIKRAVRQVELEYLTPMIRNYLRMFLTRVEEAPALARAVTV